jgi:hypothetical protein
MRHTSRSSDDTTLDPRVRTLLDAAAAPVETTGRLHGEAEALAAFRASRHSPAKNTTFSLNSARAALAAAIGASVLVTGGVSAAAAGVLPGAAQQTVSSWLKNVGISVPQGKDTDEPGELRSRSENTQGSEYTQGKAPDDNGAPRDRSEQAPGARSNGEDARCGRPEQDPGSRGNANGNQRGRPEQAPGSRGNANGAQCGRSEQAPGARGNENANQRSRSEQAPGANGNGNGNGDQRGRSEQAPGVRNNQNNAAQGGRSGAAPGAKNDENGDHRGGSENTTGDEAELPPADDPKAGRSQR